MVVVIMDLFNLRQQSCLDYNYVLSRLESILAIGRKKNRYVCLTYHLFLQVEYLREELRQTKAKLAESEFYRQKALLDLR